MKKVLGLIFLAAMVVAAQVSDYNIKRLPPGSAPVIDGDASEWPEEYFIDSLRSDDNVYAESVVPWTRANFQMKVYAAYDSTLSDTTAPASGPGRIYWAVKVIADNSNNPMGCGYTSDNLKINPGGKARRFYLWECTSAPFSPGGSSPFNAMNTDAAVSVGTADGTVLPTYEFSFNEDVVDKFANGYFPLSVGTEDLDNNPSGNCYAAIGAYYTGAKQDYPNNPWDVVGNYPNFHFVQDLGPALGVEQAKPVKLVAAAISASPNPCTPKAILSFSCKQAGNIRVYSTSGRMVAEYTAKAGSGKVTFDGANLSSGVYMVRLTSGNAVANTKIFLAR